MNKRKQLIIVGAGGHAKVLIATLRACREPIVGILDRDSKNEATSILSVRVIGNDDTILQHRPSDVLLVNGIGAVSSLAHRSDVFRKFHALGYHFQTVIHPSAVCSEQVSLGEGVQVMAGAVIQPGTVVGDNTILNTMMSIDHDCTIGSHVHIAPGATLSGGVSVGEGTHIGTGAVVIQNVSIGGNCLIAAGAVVVHDVPDCTSVAGVPARKMRGSTRGPRR